MKFMILMYADPAATEALAVAGRVIDFHVTSVEVREIHDFFGM